MIASRIALVALAVAALTAFVACGDDGDSDETPAATSTAAGSPGVTTPTQPAAATPTPPRREAVQVFFLNEPNVTAGREPFVTSVEREVDPPAVARGALEALFSGPTAQEMAQGLRFEASGATGFTNFVVGDDGIATVQLAGGCDSRGSTFTIAQEIIPTLTQFPSISYVKILDPEGDTAEPTGPSNSIPACLEP